MKKLKLLFITLALFAFLNTANAQNIEQEITSFVDETEVLINNGRRMMLHYVQTRNFERVAEIYHFLNERMQTNNCATFTIDEELLITILTNNWDDFFAIAEHFSDIRRINLCIPIPRNDLLLRTLHSEVENNASQLFENALAANVTLEEKQLLELFLYALEHGADETYRQKMRSFRRQHPQSAYNDFVRNYLPRAQLRGKMAMSLGATQVFPTGGLNNYFASSTVIGGGMDFRFNRLYLGIQAIAGSMRLKQPLPSSVTGYDYDFQKNDRFSYESIMFPVGYTLLRTNRFELTPFVGIGVTSLRSNLYGEYRFRDREFAIANDSFTIGAGLRAEFELARFNWSSLNLLFDTGYYMPVRFRYTPARGNTFYARMGIVWWSRMF